MNFLRTFFASVLGTLTAFSLVIIFGLIILSGIASIFNSSTLNKTFNSKSVLNLNFNLPILDRNPAFSEIQNFLGLDEDVIGLPNILSAIKSAEENTDIKGSQEELECIQTYLRKYGMSLTEKEKEYFSIN